MALNSIGNDWAQLELNFYIAYIVVKGLLLIIEIVELKENNCSLKIINKTIKNEFLNH